MATMQASLNTKVSPEEKDAFVRTSEALGLTPSAAIKVFVRMFNECGGFPFDVRRPQSTQTTTVLSEPDFDAFAAALERPVPPTAKHLMERTYEWAD